MINRKWEYPFHLLQAAFKPIPKFSNPIQLSLPLCYMIWYMKNTHPKLVRRGLSLSCFVFIVGHSTAF